MAERTKEEIVGWGAIAGDKTRGEKIVPIRRLGRQNIPMIKHQITKLCALSLSVILLWICPSLAQTISSPVVQTLPPQQVLQDLALADVVDLGETHDSALDHKAQLAIIQELHRRNPKIAIAMEMFQRPYQKVIDQYLAGELAEAELVEQTEYNQRWGFPWEYYAPILQFAKENHLPVIALNTPTEVTRKVARQGLSSLTLEQRQFIPPFEEIKTDNAEYRQLAQEAYEQHAQAGQGSSANFERFFLAQVLWDETMADGIVKFLTANPDYKVVAIAGLGHIIYGYGIPSRVARRLNGNRQLVQRSVLLNPSEQMRSETDKAIADYFWETKPARD